MRNRSWSVLLAGAMLVAGACDRQPTSLAAPEPTGALREAGPGGGGGGGARLMRARSPLAGILALRDTLGLSVDQVSQLKRIQAELKGLTPEQGEEFRRLRMERRRQLRRGFETGTPPRPPAGGAMEPRPPATSPELRPAGGR